jgi:hypothetical protein
MFSNYWYHCKAEIQELAEMMPSHKFAQEALVDALSSLYIIINSTPKLQSILGYFHSQLCKYFFSFKRMLYD